MGMQRTPLLMSRLIERGARLAPDAEIVTATANGTRRQDLRETLLRAHRLAHALRDAGVGVGDRVGVFMWNGSRHLEVYCALAGMGAVLLNLNVRLHGRDIAYIVNHAEPRLIVSDADLLARLEPLADRLPTVEKVVVAVEEGGEGWSTSLPGAVDYEDFIASWSGRFEWPRIDETAPLGLCYTSGTTGHPKGVQYEHRSQYLHTMAMCMTDAMSLSATDTVCGVVPMFHVMGWGLPWAALTLGCKQVMPHRFTRPERLVRLIAEEGVTLAAGVPTVWQDVRAVCVDRPGAFDLSRLERIVSGGSAVPAALACWYWEALGVEMIQEWGMTETSPLVTFSRRVARPDGGRRVAAAPEAYLAEVAKAGQALAGVEVEIFDADFNRLPHDGRATGDVLVRGPWVCSEYYRSPRPEQFHDDWLITGDVGSIDRRECLVISDRSKDLVRSGGEWISSVDLENHILSLDGVAQACVVAQPHPRWEQRPVALIVLDEGASVDRERVLTHCAGRFAKWQLPDDVLVVDSIPLTSTGKMDKKTVRADLGAAGYRLPELR
ncbi:MAG: long-chain-fatty-acid--CoA ligase [Acidobacteriota bacterium]|nr:long-chain-fatty-acid--CoA ligase [Acidobacteriota bacterium]